MPMSRYDTNRAGTSPALMELMNEYTQMPRDSFDETRRKSLDVDVFKFIPFEAFEMLPNSDIDVNFDVSLETINATIKKLQTAMSVEIYVGRIDYNDCWEAWNNFVTAGRSGKANVSLVIPHIAYAYDINEGTEEEPDVVTYTNCIPSSPAHLMNISPAVFFDSDDSAEGYLNFDNAVLAAADCTSTGLTGISSIAILKASEAMFVSALPFVAYAKLAKKMFNSNLLQDNPNWFPENENHDLILPYDAPSEVTCASYDNPTKVPSSINGFTDSTDEDFAPYLNILFNVDRKNDYFNTGSPFPDLIRGDIPTLDTFDLQLASRNINSTIDFSNSIAPNSSTHISQWPLTINSDGKIGALNSNGIEGGPYPLTMNEIDVGASILVNGTTSGTGKHDQLLNALNRAQITSTLDSDIIGSISFSMNQWRQLATMTVFRERMARTDGSYNELIKAQFGHNPKWHSHDIEICGTHKQSIVFSEVIQQSATGESALGGVSNLGDVAGRAMSVSSSNTIHVHSDDFGVYIACLCIRPDEYYTQGVSKMFSRLNPMEQYFPILNNLAPDATLNKELYVSGSNDVDNDVFNYQERFAYYKSRQNEVSGYMALPIDKVGEIGAYTFNRHFESTPSFNSEYVKGTLTDNERDLWTGLHQNKFTAVIQSRMRFIGPLPRTTRPSDMGISY